MKSKKIEEMTTDQFQQWLELGKANDIIDATLNETLRGINNMVMLVRQGYLEAINQGFSENQALKIAIALVKQ
ncbi:MAG: hypothetical protein LKF42_09095 [Streptococcaceae bacterium]|jgi:hypothetical protein|nr:hypothetical protein [Streptococcaceae bacterium]